MSDDGKQAAGALATISAVSRAVSRSLDLDEVLAIFAREMESRLGIPSGAIFIHDGQSETFRLGWGEPDDLKAVTPYLGPRSGGDSSPVLADRRVAARAFTWSSIAAIPLVTRRRQHGVVVIGTRAPGGFSPRDLEIYRTIGRDVAIAIENARLFAEVSRSNQRLQDLSRELIDVQERERRYLGLELHDQIGQMLTGLKLIIESARNGGDVRTRLEDAERIVADLMQRIRALAVELRPPMLDDAGLVAALACHVQTLSAQSGLAIDFRHAVDRPARPEIQIAAFRIAQEALTNAARHARAANISLRVWTTAGTLLLQIADDGAGFDPAEPTAGAGLRGIRERAALIGGTVSIESSRGSGTRIIVEIPL
ncbi:MAG TPA: GAF domain-containing sensor histidine kinase [Thermoanaerobaculia bacterium]|nr:GAF domain-containing sensor histidine kinase [Thermoanaerobaculia bacterium]